MPKNAEPSLGQRVSYYLLDKQMPKVHQQWVKSDINSALWPWRNGLRDGLFILVGAFLGAAISGNRVAILGALVAIPAILVMRFLGRNRARKNALRKHAL